MNAAAGNTSSSVRSKGAPRAVALAVVIAALSRSGRRVDERAFDGHVHTHRVVARDADGAAHLEQRTRRRDHFEQCVAAAILDIAYAASEGVDAARPLANGDLLGPDRHHGTRAGERLPAHAGERDVLPPDLHPVAVLAHDVELEHVAIAHETGDVQ